MLTFSAVDYASPPRRAAVPIDETLFCKIALGDGAAFSALYEQTADAVFAFALSLLRNRSDAEDAMQETFLKIRSAAHLYQPRGKPMAWVLTITRNVCMMRFRRQQHYAAVSAEELGRPAELDGIRDREDRIVLESALAHLPPEEYQIIVLHAVSGLKHREIAQILQLPLSTVLSKYSRGLGKLRRQLEGAL
ncbi:MAG: RNA polymerase sigma factor [Ruminococcaceae bacterium]|nr:RNA polymerase sigma factor [Oscillospiraceae bacterium]